MNKKEKNDLPAIDQAIIEIGELLTTLSTAVEDRRVTFKETIEIAQEAWGLKVIYTEFDNIKDEWNNHSNVDLERWENLFVTHFEIDNELAKTRVSIGVKIITLMIEFYDTFKK